MAEFVGPLQNALPHLQPAKRKHGKQQGPPKRRRCRVSDEEAEQLRQQALMGQSAAAWAPPCAGPP